MLPVSHGGVTHLIIASNTKSPLPHLCVTYPSLHCRGTSSAECANLLCRDTVQHNLYRDMENTEETTRRKRAVALRYRRGEDTAPVIVAKGAGLLADRIVEIAKEHGIPLYEDPDLVEVLSKINLGNVIPPELYQAVAEVLAFVYNLNRRMLDENGITHSS